MGQIKVVIDTNVVISAILFGGVPGKLVELWKSKAIVPFVSKEIMDEYLRVLAYPKFELSDQEIHFIIYKEILPYFEVVTSDPSKPFISSDPSDDKFIQCAICGNAAYIISGDDHLLSLKPIAGIKIVNPLNFIAIYFL
jgi:putative PIN family toxin of toxin-antitoxin system